MNPNLDKLHSYPFEKLKILLKGITPSITENIALSVGEPKHEIPKIISDSLAQNLSALGKYPPTKGILELRETICHWLCRRFNLPKQYLDPEKNVLPVTGSRQALFAIAQAVINSDKDSLVILPNPFYQIYEGAALLAGANISYLPCMKENNHLPDIDSIDKKIFEKCQLMYICTPGNPSGAVMPIEKLQHLIKLSKEFNFVLASDECYTDIYFNENDPPIGLLEASAAMGNASFTNCLAFHSLSKRSNVPGLRSGFVAGDREILEKFSRYLTYYGCAMPIHHQMASCEAWKDSDHAKKNRELYKKKFDTVIEILSPQIDIEYPEAGFYLWLRTPINDEEFSQGLYSQKNVTVLPGSFISRDINGFNPGKNFVRIALVAELEKCKEAAYRIKEYIEELRKN